MSICTWQQIRVESPAYLVLCTAILIWLQVVVTGYTLPLAIVALNPFLVTPLGIRNVLSRITLLAISGAT